MRQLAAAAAALALTCATPVYASQQMNITVQVLSSSTTSSPPIIPPSSSGGGGSTVSTNTGVTVSGRAYPLSKIVVLKDGSQAASTIAGPDGRFTVTLTRISSGTHTISVYGEDDAQRRSVLFSFPLSVTSGATTVVSGIFISPTIDTDKSEVKRGDPIAIFGKSAPGSLVAITVHSEQEIITTAQADSDGVYLRYVDSSPLAFGDHTAQSLSTQEGNLSPRSVQMAFIVGTENVPRVQQATACQKADINCDGRVDLVDYSIMVYWNQRPGTLPARVDLNGDAVVTLADLSILAYYWTG